MPDSVGSACLARYTRNMQRLGTLFLICLLAFPASGQAEEELPQVEESTPLFDLFERMLQGFVREIEPQMRELERGMQALEPDIERFIGQLRGMTQYHPPELLPNGDIILRRRQPGEEAAPSEEEPVSDPVEL